MHRLLLVFGFLTVLCMAEEKREFRELTNVDLAVILTTILIEHEKDTKGYVETYSLCFEHPELCKRLK